MWKPYSEFLHVFVSVFFFVSGAVSYDSYQRSGSVAEYLSKRVIGLLVPYYLLCALWVMIYIVAHLDCPRVSLYDLVAWLSVRPIGSEKAFSIGQVWFLHTLLVISLLSPAYFTLYRYKPKLLAVLLALPIAVSAVQMHCNIDDFFLFAENNLFKPIVHSVFYVLGFVYFSSHALRKTSRLVEICVVCLLASVGVERLLSLNPDYEFHTFAPDLYYVAGCMAAIAGLLALQNGLLAVCKNSRFLGAALGFMHRYTFPVFLLHSFSIYLSEKVLGLVHPQSNYIVYGVVKFLIVLLLTCVLAIPFGSVATWLSRRAIAWCNYARTMKATKKKESAHI